LSAIQRPDHWAENCKNSLFCIKCQFYLTIRLWAQDFYEAIADSAYGLINYHNYQSNCFSRILTQLLQIMVSKYFLTHYWTLHFNKIARIESSLVNLQLFTLVHRFFNHFKFLKSRIRLSPSFSLLRNLIIHLHPNFIPKLQKNDKNVACRGRLTATAF